MSTGLFLEIILQPRWYCKKCTVWYIISPSLANTTSISPFLRIFQGGTKCSFVLVKKTIRAITRLSYHPKFLENNNSNLNIYIAILPLSYFIFIHIRNGTDFGSNYSFEAQNNAYNNSNKSIRWTTTDLKFMTCFVRKLVVDFRLQQITNKYKGYTF